MKIYLNEIKDTEQAFTGTLHDSWVKEALDSVSERDAIKNPSSSPEKTSGPKQIAKPNTTQPESDYCTYNIRRVDDLVVVSGDLDFTVPKLCSRCGTSTNIHLNQKFSHLFTKDPEMAGVAYMGKDSRVHGKTKGKATQHHANHYEGSEIQDDLEIAYLENEYIDLKDLLLENFTVFLPFQPLCKEDCKGICLNCGTDFNKGRCACEKLNKSSPFAKLKQDLSQEFSKSLNFRGQKE